ncbi:MAG: substrate-binding domain-containing protein [Acetatifactor sp.]|nr:substrate-binding domain-containing protein [Acetatifactor sp.]
MKRKLISVLTTLAMTMTLLTGCGNQEAQQAGEKETPVAQESADAAQESTDPYKIGVIMYQWTDSQGVNIQNFCNYLQDNMNVEFQYESTYYDDDAQVSCVENLISAGCDAIISGYDTNIIAAMNTCQDAGVYYAVALDHITEDDFAGADPGSFFLGGTKQFGGDLAALGENYADAVVTAGLDNIGGVSFPVWAFSDAPEIYAGFQSKLQAAGIQVDDLTYSAGFSSDEVQSATQTLMNSNSGLKAIFGMSSGLDYIYPVLQNTDIKLISMGYDTSVESLLKNGALVAAGNNNHTQAIASCVARIINALEGNEYPDAAAGVYNEGSIVNGVANYPVIANEEQLNDYITYVVAEDGTKGSITAEELESCIISHNPDATLADLNALTNRTVEEIKAAR